MNTVGKLDLLYRPVASYIRSKVRQADPSSARDRATHRGSRLARHEPHLADVLEGVVRGDVVLARVGAVVLAVALHHLTLGVTRRVVLGQG